MQGEYIVMEQRIWTWTYFSSEYKQWLVHLGYRVIYDSHSEITHGQIHLQWQIPAQRILLGRRSMLHMSPDTFNRNCAPYRHCFGLTVSVYSTRGLEFNYCIIQSPATFQYTLSFSPFSISRYLLAVRSRNILI